MADIDKVLRLVSGIQRGIALASNTLVASDLTATTMTVNAAGELRLADSDSSNYVGFKSPGTVTTNKIWTLPDADGTSGQFLKTDGAASLSWATASGGGGGITIGDAITSGTANRVLFEDGSNNVAQDADFTFDTDTLTVTKLTTAGFNIDTSNGLTNVVLLGSGAGTSITGGARNIAIGDNALTAVSAPNDNIAIGYKAMEAATTLPFQNVVVGNYAGYTFTHGDYNTLIGHAAGAAMIGNTSWNTLIGDSCGNSITSGYSNTAVGQNALGGTTGIQNVVVGQNAGNGMGIGSDNNVMVGTNSGYLYSGDNSVFLGHFAGFRETVSGNSFIIDNQDRGSEALGRSEALLYGKFDATATNQILATPGKLGIGNIVPGSELDVNGTIRLSGSTSGYVGLAPAATAGSTTYTLPTADGNAGQKLSTDGSGTLSWATDQGTVNYISNNLAEVDTAGYDTYIDADQAIPEDGTGGATPDVTWTRNTSSPGRGVADFKFTKDAVDRRGQGASYDFSIGTADASKELDFTVDYKTEASNYSTGDLRVYFYDVTNATLITPVLVNQSDPELEATNGNWRQLTWRLWTASDSTSYRMIVHVASESAVAYTANFVNFRVGPKTFFNTPIVGPTTSFTPSWTNLTVGNGTQAWQYTRVGDLLHIHGDFTMGSTSSIGGIVQMANPIANTTITRLNNNVSNGSAFFVDSGTGSNSTSGAPYISSGAIFFRPDGTNNDVTTAVPFTWATSDRLSMDAWFKIDEWDNSSAQMSTTQANDQTAIMRAGASTTTINTSTPIIVYPNSNKDTHNGYSVSTGRYTIASKGSYRVSAKLRTGSASWSAGNVMELYVYKNGSQIRILDRINFEASNSLTGSIGGDDILHDLEVGDIIDIRCYSSVSTALAGSNNWNYFSLNRLPDFSTFGVYSDKTNCRYGGTTDTLATSLVPTIVKFNTKSFDTHNAYDTSTGLYTCPTRGTYRMKAQVWVTAAAGAVTDAIDAQIQKNSTAFASAYHSAKSTTSMEHIAFIEDIVECEVGDTLGFYPSHNFHGSTQAINNNTVRTFMHIEKISD